MERVKRLTITGIDDGKIYGIALPGKTEYVLNDKAIYEVKENGTYTALVKDMIGNTNTCSVEVAKVDSTAPTNVTATIIKRIENDITVEANAVDIESGIAKYEYSIDGNDFV